MKLVGLPKTTTFDCIRNVSMSKKGENRLAKIKEENIVKSTQRINKYNRNKRRKSIQYFRKKKMLNPGYWSGESIFLVSHFMFDGRISNGGCEYYNRSDYLINKMRENMQKLLGLDSKIRLRDFGVKQVAYYHVGLSFHMFKKTQELLKYIVDASIREKRIFLQTFFDDEGCVGKWGKKRLVRGFQHNYKILRLIQNLLNDFDIKSKIDKKYNELIITGKDNFIKFRDNINFSKGIFINPDRKNSVWKEKLEKREILNRVINAYVT